MREHPTILRKVLVAGFVASGLLGASAQGLAQPAPGAAMGPGMMGGAGAAEVERRGSAAGRDLGHHGPGHGMGPGMMGGYGPGHGMGPGMMGGYGPGHGMGPGMMGGYGPGYGMGPGMMGHHAGHHGLNLSDEQREKLDKVHDDIHRKNWELTGRIMEASRKLDRLLASEKRDRGAIASAYKEVSDLRFARFQARLDAHDAVEGVLTQDQRQQLRRGGPSGTTPIR